jgi:hypothetical protein
VRAKALQNSRMQFLVNQRRPTSDEYENVVGTAAAPWCGRGAMICKAISDNIRSQCLAFTAKRKCVLDKLTTSNEIRVVGEGHVTFRARGRAHGWVRTSGIKNCETV